MNYKAADRCDNCPKRNDEDGCPWWWEIVNKTDTNNVAIDKMCGKIWLPIILIELTKSLLRPQEAMESMRNTVKPLMDLIIEHRPFELIRIGDHGRD